MTPEKLSEIEAEIALPHMTPSDAVSLGELGELVAEVCRLRELVRVAERPDTLDTCPWCDRHLGPEWAPDEGHAVDCLAFASVGVVR